MIESIQFIYGEKVIVVTLSDGESKTYTESMKNQYLIDFPDRIEDVKAIGW